MNRVAELGHFERLSLSIYHWDKDEADKMDFDAVAPIVEALIGVIIANPMLSY